jgi:hypothetical protein
MKNTFIFITFREWCTRGASYCGVPFMFGEKSSKKENPAIIALKI